MIWLKQEFTINHPLVCNVTDFSLLLLSFFWSNILGFYFIIACCQLPIISRRRCRAVDGTLLAAMVAVPWWQDHQPILEKI